MRIGFDARLAHWPGIGRYIQALAKHLPEIGPRHEYIFYFTTAEACHLYGSQHPRATNMVFPSPVFSLQEQWQWPQRIRQDRLNLFHATHYVAPLLTPCALVVTIHDLVGFRYPDAMFSRLARLYNHWMTKTAVWRAAHLIANSHFTGRELQMHLSVQPDKITVTHLGVDPGYFDPPGVELTILQERYKIPEQYILYLGTRKPWKNLPVLLAALQQLRKQGEPIKLVMAGKNAQHQMDLSETIHQMDLHDQVREVGYIAEDDIPAIYAYATAFVLPSYYEGFGLPILEAMAAGTPVVASQAASLPEVVGTAGLIVNANTPTGFAAAITRILREPDLRMSMRQQGRARASQFTWEACAAKTISVYEQIRDSS